MADVPEIYRLARQYIPGAAAAVAPLQTGSLLSGLQEEHLADLVAFGTSGVLLVNGTIAGFNATRELAFAEVQRLQCDELRDPHARFFRLGPMFIDPTSRGASGLLIDWTARFLVDRYGAELTFLGFVSNDRVLRLYQKMYGAKLAASYAGGDGRSRLFWAKPKPRHLERGDLVGPANS